MNGDFLDGAVLGGRYEIIETIGVGGMATVYKARCRVLNRFVAIKVLKSSLKTDTEVVKKFTAEAKAAAALNHNNIVAIFDVGEDSGINYIVMEYIDGITLKEYIRRKGRLTWQEACDFGMQIGMALECAHSNNIIHRDIKPQNILVTKDRTIKVADFGIARAVDGDTQVAGEAAVGSAQYIAPEQARGGYTDVKSDIYSLGVVMYEMLTSMLPFDGDNPVQIAIMKIENDPVSCQVYDNHIPTSIADVVMRAISREQHARYRSAREMVTAVRNAVEEEHGFDLRRLNTILSSGFGNSKDRQMPMYDKAAVEGRESGMGKTTAVIISAAVALILIIAIGVYVFLNGSEPETQVPNLIGKTLEEAMDIVEVRGFEIVEDTISYEYSSEHKEGVIIDQTPDAEQMVKKNKSIEITISKGHEDGNIELPDFTNKLYVNAESVLETLELVAERIDVDSEEYEKNRVMAQEPKAGELVRKGDTVMLMVSTGEAPTEEEPTEDPNEDTEGKIQVPRIVGMQQEVAENEIRAAGLTVGLVSSASSEQPAGIVISQSPASTYHLEAGEKVSYIVSSGPTEVLVTPVPTPDTTVTPTEEPAKRKYLSIQIPETAGETVNVRVVANGKEIHNRNHNKSEGTVDILVESKKDATVQAYIDGTLVMEKVVEFD